jgi:hypothetical protein
VKQLGSWLKRVVRGFAMFWWDFLVGDTPELFVAALLILGVVALISVSAHANTLAVVFLPLFVIVALGLSVLRAVNEAKKG